MDFFESLPEPASPPIPARLARLALPARPAWVNPAAVLPTGLAVNAVLVRAEQIAVSIDSLSVSPNGFDFRMHIRSRGDAEEINPFGRHRRYADYIQDSDREAPDPSQALRLGIQFADGRRAASTEARPHAPTGDRVPGELVVRRGSGGGGGGSWDLSYWIHPLPPPGPVTIVVSWLAQGITEARHEMDGARIRAAAEEAIQLWPEEPPGGWIARQLWRERPPRERTYRKRTHRRTDLLPTEVLDHDRLSCRQADGKPGLRLILIAYEDAAQRQFGTREPTQCGRRFMTTNIENPHLKPPALCTFLLNTRIIHVRHARPRMPLPARPGGVYSGHRSCVTRAAAP